MKNQGFYSVSGNKDAAWYTTLIPNFLFSPEREDASLWLVQISFPVSALFALAVVRNFEFRLFSYLINYARRFSWEKNLNFQICFVPALGWLFHLIFKSKLVLKTIKSRLNFCCRVVISIKIDLEKSVFENFYSNYTDLIRLSTAKYKKSKKFSSQAEICTNMGYWFKNLLGFPAFYPQLIDIFT